MVNAAAGWFDDGTGKLRWWDGTQWTTHYADPATGALIDGGAAAGASDAKVSTGSKATSSGFNLKAAIILLSVIVVVILAASAPPALLLLGLAVGAVGVYALVKGSIRGLRIRTRPVAVAVLVAGLLASSIGGAALAAPQPPSDKTASETPRAAVPTPTLTPTPPPNREEEIIEERAVIAFTSSTVDDPNLDVGATAVATAGANGEKVTRIRVTSEDGREISRVVIDEVVSVQPVNEIVAVGSRQPPPPPPPANNDCDSNYDGACVPISSDVDCAGGSGNGPAYVEGPVRIIGSDVYDLDRDGDGVACDT